MAYPVLEIKNGLEKSKPNVLVISDSFYWVIIDNISKLFSNASSFWFYNKEIFPNDGNIKYVEQVSLLDELVKYDIIILMATEATLPNFGWGFIENSYNEFNGLNNKPEYNLDFMKKVADLINYIKTDENWYNSIVGKAKNKGISVDSMLMVDAIWQIEQNLK
ncbi:MAG: hypothetical protein HC906_14240 [Bacteroidales bacterium]|nr:hypothetical protein [Bacteroidales bacterium]